MSQESLTPPNANPSPALRQSVRSPEQYQLDLPLAGPTSRMLAYSIDYVAIVILQIVAIIVLALIFPLTEYAAGFLDEVRGVLESEDPDALAETSSILVVFGFFIVVQLLIEWGYFILSEMVSGGRSIGKAIVKLRVVGDGAHPLRFGQSVARNLLRAVDILPGYYVVGLAAMVASDDGKRLGDLAAGTLVIRLDRPLAAPSISLEPSPGTTAFRFSREQIQRLGRQEQRLVRQTLRRVSEVDREQAEIALARTVAVIAARIEHEPISDSEQEDFLRAILQAAETR